MASITVKNLADEVHRSLQEQAKANKTSVAAEVRRILEEATQAKEDPPRPGEINKYSMRRRRG